MSCPRASVRVANSVRARSHGQGKGAVWWMTENNRARRDRRTNGHWEGARRHGARSGQVGKGCCAGDVARASGPMDYARLRPLCPMMGFLDERQTGRAPARDGARGPASTAGVFGARWCWATGAWGPLLAPAGGFSGSRRRNPVWGSWRVGATHGQGFRHLGHQTRPNDGISRRPNKVCGREPGT